MWGRNIPRATSPGLRKQVNALKRRVKRCKNPALRVIYGTCFKDLKNHYRAEILMAKQDSWKKFCTDSIKSSPWKIYMCKAGFTRQPVPNSLTLPDGSNSTTAEETAIALLHKFFPDDHTAHDSAQQKSIMAQIAFSKPPASQAVPKLKDQEVEEIISKLQDRKCPGPDGINRAIVKRMRKMLPTSGQPSSINASC